MFKRLGLSIAAALAGLALISPATALAAEHRDRGHGHYARHEHFRDHDRRFYGGVYFGPSVGPYYGPYADGYYDQWGIWHPYVGLSFGW
ncbi:MAG TPA: hypothetical protein VH639_07860 [Bryobacteraceae bacterium]